MMSDLEKKIALYTQNIENGIDVINSYFQRGNVYQDLKNYELALKDYTKAIELDKNYSHAYYNRGIVYRKLKKYELALRDCTKAIEFDKNDSGAYNNRGNVYHELKNYDLALEDFTKAIELDKNYSHAYYNRGIVYQGLKKYELALNDYTKAIELDKNYLTAYNNRGIIYRELKKYELALDNYTKAIELDKNYLTAYNNRGNVYHELKKYELALDNYTKAIELDKNDSDAYNNRGIIYRELKNYELALRDYTKTIELDKNDSEAYFNRGVVYKELKKYELALRDYTKAIELDKNYLKAYINRGNVYSKLKNYESALIDYTEAIELDKNYTDAYNNRGSVYYDLKNYELALKDYLQVIELNKEYSTVYLNLFLLYDDIGDFVKMKFYGHLYLYYSFKEREIELRSTVLNLWQDNIYNYKFLLENFAIDFDSFLFVNYKSKLQHIQPIEDYYNFLCISNLDQRTKESQRAILNYYLGSPVAAYIQYDEVLDEDYYPLTAQELYYYSLMADILKLDAEEILNAAIEELAEKEDKSAKDLYYLGQLYLLNSNEVEANECFKNSQEFVPSFILFMSFEKDKATQKQLLEKLLKLNQDVLISYFTGYPRTTIETENSFETQFEHYFFTTELFAAVSKIKERYQLPEYLQGYNHLKIWETFYLPDSEQAIIDKAFQNHKIQELVDTITQDLEIKLVSIDVTEKTNYLEKIKHSLREDQDLDIREAFDSLLKTLKENGNLENHLGQMIEKFQLEKIQLYLYFISYFYLQGNLDSYQAFSLFSYLLETVSLKKSKAIKESLELLIPSDFSELFITTIGLSRHLYKLVHLHKAYNVLFEDYSAYQLQKESHYMTFKKNINTYISINKETLSEEMFNKKFQCFPAIIEHNLKNI
ncbi:tetratricopeptide repeat protein [Kordia periserrulae]|uniref:Tetratricopeptide repeat protein n=1 Tax=Kordia periserrulae TaxID=701523 RepID=A0A2T6C465_9FLAO|nr:tetratricopeptide repeat protein [Kordia periserrulae]PTX63077.1 tetratricopeptide repeat protein [Kordia periserrulae]